MQRFSITLFALVNYMVLVRSLSKPQMGTWALFLIVTTVFETTKSALLKNAHIKYMSTSSDVREKREIASVSFVINSGISILFILAILLFSGQLGVLLNTGPDLMRMLIWFIPGLICMVIFSHLEATQQSHLDFKGVFAGYFVRQVVFFLAILAHTIAKVPFTLEELAMYQSISLVLGTFVIYLYTRKYMEHRFSFSLPWTRRIVAYGGYIFGSGAVSNIFLNLDQLMTAAFLSSSSVAYYNAANRINQLIDIPSYAAADVIFPKVSRASAEEGNSKVNYLYERMVSILLSFTIPTALFIIVFPKFIITEISGARYIAAAPILQLYMITGILRPVQNQAANVLNSIGKSGLVFALNCIYLAGNLGINYYCLHRFGFYGAAFGSVITFSLGAVMWYFVMKKQIGFRIGAVWGYMLDLYKMIYAYAIKLFSKNLRS
jgi:O-antigen/teichoic acid export membrane protein